MQDSHAKQHTADAMVQKLVLPYIGEVPRSNIGLGTAFLTLPGKHWNYTIKLTSASFPMHRLESQ
jgi:hypothetical protein